MTIFSVPLILPQGIATARYFSCYICNVLLFCVLYSWMTGGNFPPFLLLSVNLVFGWKSWLDGWHHYYIL